MGEVNICKPPMKKFGKSEQSIAYNDKVKQKCLEVADDLITVQNFLQDIGRIIKFEQK